MRKIAVMSSVAVLLSLGGLPPSSADTPGCVSRHEYDRVAKGMSMTKVHAIFDTEGAETNLGGGSGELRYYDTCTGRGAIQVGYNGRDRVTGKNGRFF